VDWSYGLLNAAEQTLFRRLSVFTGGCTLEGVEAVCDTKSDLGLDILDGMASMVDKSLAQQVEQVDAETRFLMLSTIREYALERLVESNDELAARRAHAAYYLVLAEEGAEDMVAHPEWLDRFEVEHDNFRTALDYLIRTGMPNGAFATAPSCFASGKRGNISRRAVMLSPGSSRWKGPPRVRSSVPACCSLPRFWRASRAIMALRGNCSKKVSRPVSNSTITAALPSH
jgi:hypothetical protein